MAWFRHTSRTTISSGGLLVASLVDSSANVLLTEATITRVLLRIDGSVKLSSIARQSLLSFGLIVVTEQAAAAGAAAMPDPASPGGADWMWWTRQEGLPTHYVETAGQTDYDATAFRWEINMDLHGQRKLRENNRDLVLLVGEEDGRAPSVTLSASTLLRLG